MRARSTTPRRPRAFTIIELQVAMVLLGVALAGVVPLVVIQSKQVRRLEGHLGGGATHYLAPPPEPWAARLGAAAAVLGAPPAPPAPGPPSIVDDGDAGYAETGTGWATLAYGGAYQGDVRYSASGTEGETAVWQFTGLAPGWHEVFVTWAEYPELAHDASYAVYDGATLKGTFAVNQRLAPGGAVVGGRPWHSLGLVQVEGDTVRVVLTHNTGQVVEADAARIVRITNELTLNSVEKTFDSLETTAHVTVTVHIPP